MVERPGKPLLCIEIKSSEEINEKTISSFYKITQEIGDCEAMVLSRDSFIKKFEHVTCYPWQEGLEVCFKDSLLGIP